MRDYSEKPFGGYRSAEEQWKAEARKRSPQFKPISEYRKLQREREQIAARVLGYGTAYGLIYATVGYLIGSGLPHPEFGLVIAAFSAVGFFATLWVAVGRHHADASDTEA